jgi:hypothetical protein
VARNRGALPPYQTYRHPMTGEPVRYHEGVDAELECLLQSGRYDDEEGERVLMRMAELAQQSTQNRSRIAKRIIGEDFAGRAVVS